MVLLSLLQVSASLLGLFWGGWVFLTRSLFDEVQGRDTLVQVRCSDPGRAPGRTHR